MLNFGESPPSLALQIGVRLRIYGIRLFLQELFKILNASTHFSMDFRRTFVQILYRFLTHSLSVRRGVAA